MSLGVRVRDERGRLRHEVVAEVQEAAKKAYDRLVKAEDPRVPEPKRDPSGEVALTIAAGLEAALSVPDGMFPVESEHVRDMRRYKAHVLNWMPDGVTTWDELTSVSYA
jgi:hypothetical protein